MRGRDIKKHPSPTQFRIICYMIEHKDEDIYQKTLETHLGISKSTISDVLNTMEKNKILNRVPDSKDGRIKKIVFNDTAILNHNKAKDEIKQINSLLTNGINKEDLDTFIKVITHMKKNIDDTL